MKCPKISIGCTTDFERPNMHKTHCKQSDAPLHDTSSLFTVRSQSIDAAPFWLSRHA